jgi:hypothetical protein
MPVANVSQPESMKSGPFLKDATSRPFSFQAEASPRDIMVLPEPPFKAVMVILGVGLIMIDYWL